MTNLRILVIEDDPTISKLVYLFAKRRGVHAVTVGTCADALSVVVPGESDFAMILMDWGLPDGSGLECARIVRERYGNRPNRPPIVAMTANMMTGDKETCLAAGMDDYIGKPFSIAQFNELVERWLDGDSEPDRCAV